MVIVRLSGGLGNQMFQYATGKAIASHNNDLFKIDTSFYLRQSLRKYSLGYFDIDEDIAKLHEIERLSNKSNFVSILKQKLGFSRTTKSHYYEDRLLFDKSVFSYQDSVYLEGYWQSEKYFFNIREDIIKCFTLKEGVGRCAQSYLTKIKCENSISIHVRRGDYAKDSKTNSIHGLCDISYYQRAVEFMELNVNRPQYFIFSDEIEWCIKNFTFIEGVTFVKGTRSALEDLELMKNCKHNIIANSTFSWWGGWLNKHKDKIVIAPKKWFSSKSMQVESENILPDEWLKL